MTTYAASGRPSYAVTMWADDNAVYVELPCKDGPPYITKYAYSEQGLSKALTLMRDLYRKDNHPVMLTTHPKLVGKPQTTTSASQRARALNILKRMGIV